MNNQKENVATNIAIELFKQSVARIEDRINSTSFKNEVKYHSKALNAAMANNFNQIVDVLQSVVDSYYINHYEINGFIPFSVADFDICKAHNLGIITNCKKLIAFAEI